MPACNLEERGGFMVSIYGRSVWGGGCGINRYLVRRNVPLWRRLSARLSVCCVPTPRDALWSTPGKRPDESGRGRHECLRHVEQLSPAFVHNLDGIHHGVLPSRDKTEDDLALCARLQALERLVESPKGARFLEDVA